MRRDGDGDEVTIVCYVRRVRASRYRETGNTTEGPATHAAQEAPTTSMPTTRSHGSRFAGRPCAEAHVAFRRPKNTTPASTSERPPPATARLHAQFFSARRDELTL